MYSSLFSQTSGSDLMAVQPDSGRVYLVRGLTKEEVGSEVTAVLTATDGGNPMLWGTASVVLRVLNCTNDTFRYLLITFSYKLMTTSG